MVAVTDQFTFLGVTFTSATTLEQGGQLDPAFPPHSGTAVIFDSPTSTITTDFSPTACSAGGYITGNIAITVSCFDAAGNLLGTEATPGANYLGASTGLSPNLFIGIDPPGATGISQCTFAGAGNTFTMDDFTFIAPCLLSCPPDPWFQDPVVIAKLTDLWNLSNPGGPVAGRLEQGAFIFQTADGFDVFELPPSPHADPCSLGRQTVTIFSDYVAWVHTHIIADDEIVPPLVCARYPDGGTGVPGPSVDKDAPSALRINEAALSLGTEIKHYILDPDGIIEFTVDENGNVVSQPRFGGCGIIN